MPSLAAGTMAQLTATATMSDLTTRNVTTMVQWSSAAAATASVDAAGVLRGLVAGNATISARLGTVTGTTTATITTATLSSIEVSPSVVSLPIGVTRQLTAIGRFSDNTTQTLNDVTWASAATARATVSNTGLVTARAVGDVQITATRGTIMGSSTVTVTPATLVSIAITPPTPRLADGRSLDLVATGTFSDNTTQNLTTQVTWASATPATATIVADTGRVTAVAVGSTEISATMGTIRGTTTLTVTAAELETISVTPATPSVAAGRTQQFTAMGTFSDGSTQNITTQATWTSSDANLADISNAAGSQGLATTLRKGEVTITATASNRMGTARLTVTDAVLVAIDVTPVNPSIALGRTQQFVATGRFSDNTTQTLTSQVTWTSETPAVASISNDAATRGLATSVSVGSTLIRATLGEVAGTSTLTVTAAVLVSIAVDPPTPSITLGRTQQFTATGTFSDTTTQPLTNAVMWTSETPAVAEISNADGSRGLATSRATGTTKITATLQGVTGEATLTVTAAVLERIEIEPVNPSLVVGLTLQFKATGVFSDRTNDDITDEVAWTSSDEAVATISNTDGSEGLATGRAAGATTIRAALGEVSATTTLTVNNAVLTAIDVTPVDPSIPLGRTQQFRATGRFNNNTTRDLTSQVTWTSATPAVASISNDDASRGLATSLSVGSTVIRATLGEISGTSTLTVTAAVLVSIAVDPPTASIALGRTQQFTATGTFSDQSTQPLTNAVTWASETPTVATISNADDSRGLATSRAVGTTKITATLQGVTGEATLTVTAAVLQRIEIAPVNPSIAQGTTLAFTATGVFSDQTNDDITAEVTWSSSDEAVATISNADGSKGLAVGGGIGSTTIRAGLEAVSATTTLTVTNAALVAIEVAPAQASLPAGRTQQFRAVGRFNNDTTQDLTNQVTWSTETPEVATISNEAGSRGLARGRQVGTTRVIAALASVTGTATLTVTAAVLESITITPPTASVALGRAQQFTATGTFSDGTTQPLTNAVTWVSETPTVATISNADGSRGLATSRAVGTTKITATLQGVTGEATLTVTAAVLARIDVTPMNPSVALGRTQQFTATGVFSDLTNANLTNDVTWSSSDLAVATISNAAGSKGLATALAVGTTAIQATLGELSGQTALTVTAAALVAIEVTPIQATVPVGRTQQFTATGRFSDNTVQPLTEQVTWATADRTIAQISNLAGSRGLATALVVGTTAVTATLEGVTGTASLEVTDAVLEAITLTPINASVAKGLTVQYRATGTFSDLSQVDITEQVTWESSDIAVAQISNAADSRGLATSLGVGTATITATFGVISGSTSLAVTGAVLQAIAVQPANPTLIEGVFGQFAAEGRFTDGTFVDLTTQVTWTSSDPAVAEISNAEGSRGIVLGVAPGTTTISATLNGVTGTTTLTVVEAVLTAVLVEPSPAQVSQGEATQFTAIAVFNEELEVEVTDLVTWTSSDPAVAAISNAEGTEGRATGLTAGVTTISATLGDVTGSTQLTVLAAAVGHLVINEVDYDQVNQDTAEFVEIFNPTSAPISLAGKAIALVNGANNQTYDLVDLAEASQATLAPGQYLVLGPAAVLDALPSTVVKLDTGWSNIVQNGSPDAVALIDTVNLRIIDALSYEGSITAAVLPGFEGTRSLVEGTALLATTVDNAGGSLCRAVNGVDTDNAATDWKLCPVNNPGVASP